MKLSNDLCLECSTCAIFLSSSLMVSMIALFLSRSLSDIFMIEPFMLLFMVYFPIWASKTLQKSSAIQKISVTLSSVIIAIIVCKLLIFSTLKLQQFSLITKFSDTYISSNSRYLSSTFTDSIFILSKLRQNIADIRGFMMDYDKKMLFL